MNPSAPERSSSSTAPSPDAAVGSSLSTCVPGEQANFNSPAPRPSEPFSSGGRLGPVPENRRLVDCCLPAIIEPACDVRPVAECSLQPQLSVRPLDLVFKAQPVRDLLPPVGQPARIDQHNPVPRHAEVLQMRVQGEHTPPPACLPQFE